MISTERCEWAATASATLPISTLASPVRPWEPSTIRLASCSSAVLTIPFQVGSGSGMAHTGWRPFSDNVPERVARLIHSRRMGPTILVFPDCFTALGGNQYINSSAVGNYADYLTRELIPFVDREFRQLGAVVREHGRAARSVVGIRGHGRAGSSASAR